MRSKELWLVQEKHVTVKPDLLKWKHSAKAELNCEIYES